MNKTECQNCQYYIQHYAILQQHFARIYCGHCTYSKVKRKVPDAPGCIHFSPGPRDTEAFVTKEYLTKALLNHVFKMELLPEIIDVENYCTEIPEEGSN